MTVATDALGGARMSLFARCGQVVAATPLRRGPLPCLAGSLGLLLGLGLVIVLDNFAQALDPLDAAARVSEPVFWFD